MNDDDDRSEDTLPDVYEVLVASDPLGDPEEGAVADLRRVGRGMYDYLLSDRVEGDDEVQALARFFRLW